MFNMLPVCKFCKCCKSSHAHYVHAYIGAYNVLRPDHGKESFFSFSYFHLLIFTHFIWFYFYQDYTELKHN